MHNRTYTQRAAGFTLWHQWHNEQFMLTVPEYVKYIINTLNITDHSLSYSKMSIFCKDLFKCVCVQSVSGDVTALPRGTPLYGQPSWWGDGDADDENSFKQETKSSHKKHDSSGRKCPDFPTIITNTHTHTSSLVPNIKIQT